MGLGLWYYTQEVPNWTDVAFLGGKKKHFKSKK